MKKIFLILLLTQTAFSKSLETNPITKKNADKLKVFLGKPVYRFIYAGDSQSVTTTSRYSITHKALYINNESCEFTFMFDESGIVYDVSISSESCFGEHTFRKITHD